MPKVRSTSPRVTPLAALALIASLAGADSSLGARARARALACEDAGSTRSCVPVPGTPAAGFGTTFPLGAVGARDGGRRR